MTGRDKKHINEKIRNVFSQEIDGHIIRPSLDARGYVIDYFLPETESIMLAALFDKSYLRKIAEFWENRNKPQLPQSYPEALRAQADEQEKLEIAIATKAEIGHRREATAMNTASQAVKKANKLEVELDKSQEYCTIKRMQMIQHGQQFNWRLLKSTSAEMDIPSIDVFDQNYGTVKAYHVDVWQEAYGIGL